MSDLEKRISGDWIELREKANDLHSLLDALAVPPHKLRTSASALRHSVEQGIIEYKRTLFAPVLVALETSRYKALAPDDMGVQESSLSVLLLAILVQRLFCLESIPLVKPRDEKRDLGVDSLQVGAILTDVNARLKANPGLRAHPAVKNILMQVQRYNAENHKMRELLPTIKAEMRRSFLANFSQTFDEVIASIRRQYSSILEEEEASADTARKESFSLAQVSLKELAPLLSVQAREVSKFRSTLANAREEKYKIRESLVRLYDGRHVVLRLVEDELKAYRRLCQRIQQDDIDGCANAMAAGFRDEVANLLEKHGNRGGRE
jgi:hypothetical protein